MANVDGYVLPKPGIPKTLGILNIIFGVLLVLYGLCQVGSLIAAPAMMQFAETTAKQVQAKAEAQKQAQLKQFDDRAAAAKTDEEKKAIEDEKAVVASEPAPPQLDMSAVTSTMTNPTIITYSFIQMGTGVLMNSLLIAAGIGLIRLADWGRKLSLWLAGIQIVRLALLTAASIMVVQPVTAELTAKMFEKMEADAKVQGGGQAAANSMQLAKTMAGAGSIMAVGYFVFGSIYPVVSLILLSNPGARAACQGKKIEGEPEYLS